MTPELRGNIWPMEVASSPSAFSELLDRFRGDGYGDNQIYNELEIIDHLISWGEIGKYLSKRFPGVYHRESP